MKNLIFLVFIVFILSCKKDDPAIILPDVVVNDVWQKNSDFPASANAQGMSFVIGSKGYVGLGFGTGKSVWEYDTDTNLWTKKKDFPFALYDVNYSFSIQDKGYVITTAGGVFEYNATSDSWISKYSFPGETRISAAGFVVNNRAYIGTGSKLAGATATALNDLWEYDPASDKWAQMPNVPGNARSMAIGFSIGDRGYIGFGQAVGPGGPGTLTFFNDFYAFNAVKKEWTQKSRPITADPYKAFAFSMLNKGYFGFKTQKGEFEHWEYHPNENIWKKKQALPSSAFYYTQVLAIQDRAFLVGGFNSSTGNYSKEVWQYN